MHDILVQLINLLQENATVFYMTVAIFSLCVGSFLNVVIHRLPIIMENEYKKDYHDYFYPHEPALTLPKYTLSTPASTCPKCHHQIRWFENIPIISWLVLAGKCSHCKNPISIRYPFVELATMLASLMVAIHFGVTLQAVFGIIFTWILIALTGIDFDKQLLPDSLTYPLIALGLIANSLSLYISPIESIWGAVIGFLSLWVIYILYKLITGKIGMGYGDFKLLAALGAWLGYANLPFIILLSSIIGAIVGIALLKIYKESTPFAFGPYLAIAGWISFIWGDQIIASYLATITVQ